jgi:PAS domain S-box-containing protein
MDAPASTADRIAALEADLARLAASESMYRTAMELSGRMAWAADAGGAITVMRTPFSTVTGVAEEDAMGEGWLSIVHLDDRDRVKHVWRAAVASGERYVCEFRARRADGAYRLMCSLAVPLRGEDLSIVGWTGTTEDIEEKKHTEQARRDAEERLRESEEVHRYTLELSRQIVFTAAPDGKIFSISPRFWELTGLEPGTRPREAIFPRTNLKSWRAGCGHWQAASRSTPSSEWRARGATRTMSASAPRRAATAMARCCAGTVRSRMCTGSAQPPSNCARARKCIGSPSS